MELNENNEADINADVALGDCHDDAAMFSGENATPESDIDSDVYSMDFPNRGKCLIFNQKTYEDSTGLQEHERKGTDSDAAALLHLFKQLKFDVYMFQNAKKSFLLKQIEKVAAADHSQNSCFVCCILTHGDNGILYASDDTYTTDELFSPFCSKKCKLAGKPKLFFIQACQGCEEDDGITITNEIFTDGIDDQAYKIPTHADFLIAYATVPGFKSWRYQYGGYTDKGRRYDEGSWFMQSLCSVLQEHAKDMDLLKMLTKVNRKVAYKYPLDPRHKMKQMSCITSTLTRDVIFPVS